MKITIIISTYNREPYLRRLLASFSHLYGNFEVVIVNGPSADGTENLLQQYAGRIKVVNCPVRNLSVSRNLGIQAAAGDIVVFTDDDALPIDPYWLERYRISFAGDEEGAYGVFGGPAYHRDSKWFEFDGGLMSDYSFQIFHFDNNLPYPPKGKWFERVSGNNAAIRRNILCQIGGFDEFYSYYADETDLCWRVCQTGYKIKNIRENPVRHYSGSAEYRKSSHDRGWDVITKSDTYFALKNGQDPLWLRLLKTIYFAPRKHFFREIVSYWKRGEISFWRFCRYVIRWLRGLLSGLYAGLFKPRKLFNFKDPPPPFLPFSPLGKSKVSLKIALLSQTNPTQSNYGGVGRYTYDLALGLCELGHNVHIFSRDEQPQKYQSLGFVIHGVPLRPKHIPESVFIGMPVLDKNLSYSAAVYEQIKKVERETEEKFDLIHMTNWDEEGVAVIRSGEYPTVMMLVTSLAESILSSNWKLTNDLRLCIAMDAWQIEQSEMACAPSNGVIQSYRELMPLRADILSSINITPLGIVPAGSSNNWSNLDKKGRFRLLYVGRFERRKGIHILLDVLPSLLKQHSDWECHLVGDDSLEKNGGGTYKDEFIIKYFGQPWLKRVIFHGKLSESELLSHYQSCDLFVAPSLFESFGLMYHEAMQFGKPVVGCNVGGVSETVKNEKEGLLVLPNSSQELENALSRLMADKDLRLQMGVAGAERVRANQNYRTMAANFEKVYVKAIEKFNSKNSPGSKNPYSRYNLPLLIDDSDVIRRTGQWQLRTPVEGGRPYLFSETDSSLSFYCRGAKLISVYVLRHEWSGVLALRINGKLIQFFDLYNKQMEFSHCLEFSVPGYSSELYNIQLSVFSEKNPNSLGTEVWLKEILLNAPLESL